MSAFPWFSLAADIFGNIFGISKEQEMLEQQQRFQWSTMLHQNDWNEKMMYKQADLEGAQYQKYQSPVSQRRQMEAAGINPFLEGSAIQPMSVSSASGASPGSSSNGLPGASGRGIGQYFANSGAALGQALQLDADLKLKDAQRRNIDADTRSKDNANNAFDVELEREIRRLFRDEAQADAAMAQIKASFAQMRELDDMMQREAVYRKTLQDIDNLVKQGKLSEESAKLVKEKINTEIAQQNLLNEQARDLEKTRDSRNAANWSQADLNKAQKLRTDILRMTDEDLRTLRKEELQEKVQQIRGLVTKNAVQVEREEILRDLDRLEKELQTEDSAKRRRVLRDIANTVWSIIPLNAIGGILK